MVEGKFSILVGTVQDCNRSCVSEDSEHISIARRIKWFGLELSHIIKKC